MKAKNEGTIIVPELEEVARTFPKRPWTKEEDDVVRAYYGKVPNTAISRYLKKKYPPGRSPYTIKRRANVLGITTKE